MAENEIKRTTMGFEHPDYSKPIGMEAVLTDFLRRIEKLESAYVSVDAEIKYDYQEDCCEEESCFMCKE